LSEQAFFWEGTHRKYHELDKCQGVILQVKWDLDGNLPLGVFLVCF